MYVGELKLGVLALTDLNLRVTAQGLVLEASDLCKKRDGIGPSGSLPYRRSTTWTRELMAKATELVEQVEREMGQELGGEGETVPSTDSDEPLDLASILVRKEGELPKQF